MPDFRDEEPRWRTQDRSIRISGQDARGGEIILRTRRRRIIFLGGLIGIVLLALTIRFAGLA